MYAMLPSHLLCLPVCIYNWMHADGAAGHQQRVPRGRGPVAAAGLQDTKRGLLQGWCGKVGAPAVLLLLLLEPLGGGRKKDRLLACVHGLPSFEMLPPNASCCCYHRRLQIVLHPRWGSAVYPASLFTKAPLSVLLDAIRETEAQLQQQQA